MQSLLQSKFKNILLAKSEDKTVKKQFDPDKRSPSMQQPGGSRLNFKLANAKRKVKQISHSKNFLLFLRDY